jgi:hypothetical protein
MVDVPPLTTLLGFAVAVAVVGGLHCTVTVTEVRLSAGPVEQEFVARTQYFVVALGVTVIVAPVPTCVVVSPGLPVNQVKVGLVPLAVAESVELCPGLIVAGLAEGLGVPTGVQVPPGLGLYIVETASWSHC